LREDKINIDLLRWSVGCDDGWCMEMDYDRFQWLDYESPLVILNLRVIIININ
jgi:hypothetical protein